MTAGADHLARLEMDAEGRVAIDLTCVKCGFNLRRRRVTADCPKCGHRIVDSLSGDFLLYGEPARIKRLAEAVGVVMLGAGLLAVLIGPFLLGTVFAAGEFARGVDAAYKTLFFGAVIGPLLAIIGIVMIGRSYLAQLDLSSFLKPRRLLHYGSRLLPASLVVAALAVFARTVLFDVALVTWVAVAPALFLHHLARLMYQIPSPELGKSARLEFIGTLFFAAAALLIRLIDDLALDDRGWSDFGLGLTFINLLGGVLLGLNGCLLLVRARRALLRAAREATRNVEMVDGLGDDL